VAAKRIRIMYTDREPLEVRMGPSAQVQVEDHFDMGLTDMNRVTHVYYMAWASAHHAKLEHRSYAEFLDAIDDVEMVADPEPGPTVPAQSPDSSSS
jgi:hypothetical protein